MDFISLDKVLDGIACKIPVSDAVAVAISHDEVRAFKFSSASATLHQKLSNSQAHPNWAERHKATRKPVFNNAIASEGMAMLEHMAGWYQRTSRDYDKHLDFCIKAGLDPKTEPPLINLNSGQYTRDNVIRGKEIGFNRAELVAFLDNNEIAHSLASDDYFTLQQAADAIGTDEAGIYAMQQRPEIVLPLSTEFVRTGDIPTLIAKALHPEAGGQPETITKLIKTAKPGATGQTADWNGWPIDDDDRAILDGIWAHLSKLVLPITVEAWKPYAETFQENGSRLDWELKSLINSPSLNAAILRHTAEQDHLKQLRTTIERGELKQLSPASNIATATYLENGKVDIEALTQYVKQFHIGVRLALLVDDLPAIYERQFAEKQAEGRYTLKEAAKFISEQANERDEAILKKLVKAAKSKTLYTFAPGSRIKYESNDVRDFYEEVYWYGLNKWIKENEPLIGCEFPNPNTQTAVPAAKMEAAPVTIPVPAIGKQAPPDKKVKTNKKIWDDPKLRTLWEESLLPGVTQESLAEKHGVKRQRISALIKQAKDKFKPQNNWVNPPQNITTRKIRGTKY